MTLKDFLSTYDHENAIILLEGKRTVATEDWDKLQRLGQLLADRSHAMKFRSGNAHGADYYFSLGVADINPGRLQVITPNSSHRKSKLLTDYVIALDQLDISGEDTVVSQSKLNKKTVGLVTQYVDGRRDWLTQKAAFIIRDTIKVIGTSTIPPATFAIFYDDLQEVEAGGTGHTMNVCKENNVPFIDQRTWFAWLDEEYEEPYDSLYDEEYEEILNLDWKIVSTETLRLADFEVIKNDLIALIDLAFVKFVPDTDVIMHLQHFDKIEVFNRIVEMVSHYPNLAYRAWKILGKVVGKGAGTWIKEQWEKSERHDLRFFAEPLIDCLDVEVAFEIITKEIERTDINDVGNFIEYLLHFKNDRILDWIETMSERIISIKRDWGHLAAGSNFSWERADKWLSLGRPLSLIALEALVFCWTDKKIQFRSYDLRKYKATLVDTPPHEVVIKRLQEYHLIDTAPRTKYAINLITKQLQS